MARGEAILRVELEYVDCGLLNLSWAIYKIEEKASNQS